MLKRLRLQRVCDCAKYYTCLVFLHSIWLATCILHLLTARVCEIADMRNSYHLEQ